jgi:hypothetical protein
VRDHDLSLVTTTATYYSRRGNVVKENQSSDSETSATKYHSPKKALARRAKKEKNEKNATKGVYGRFFWT